MGHRGEAAPLEELGGPRRRRHRENGGEPHLARVLEDVPHQAETDALSLEASDRVEGDHLADAVRDIRRGAERGDPGEVARPDPRAEAGEEDRRDLVAPADLQETLALA